MTLISLDSHACLRVFTLDSSCLVERQCRFNFSPAVPLGVDAGSASRNEFRNCNRLPANDVDLKRRYLQVNLYVQHLSASAFKTIKAYIQSVEVVSRNKCKMSSLPNDSLKILGLRNQSQTCLVMSTHV
ncbi:hypothetical protein DPMN_055994 [Dreissena polymorpha]|uniref:Uncharacterized protein n=1 Tax=Dreissena polymorpha TaxID=45954 RepID=A0A9D4HT34_DREPO|nr:hypothetical protein DPMN_055994 [Dreissena polymorpha]